MLNFQIVIADEDIAYSEKLANYLMNYTHHHFSVNLFSDLTNLTNYLNNNQADILITTEKLYLKMQAKFSMTILLTDYSVRNELKHMPCINKYQKGEKITTQIILNYTKYCEKDIIGQNLSDPFKVIGFYSPAGGSGKTTLSVAYAMLLSLKGYRTLFFSLEEYPSYSNLLTLSNETSLSDMLYHLKNKPNNLLMKLEGIIRYDHKTGLMFLPPPLYPKDIILSDANDWSYFLEQLHSNGQFDRLIIDFTCTHSLNNDIIMEACNKIILPTNMSSGQNSKVKAFIDNIDEPIIEKIILIANYTMSSEKEYISEIYNLKLRAIIPYISNLHEDNEFKQALEFESPFKKSILRLMEVVEGD